MRRRSPKLLCEVLKSKNVVCTPNYNVINSYLPFSFFFSFFYDNVIAIRCIYNFHLSIIVSNCMNEQNLEYDSIKTPTQINGIGDEPVD